MTLALRMRRGFGLWAAAVLLTAAALSVSPACLLAAAPLALVLLRGAGRARSRDPAAVERRALWAAALGLPLAALLAILGAPALGALAAGALLLAADGLLAASVGREPPPVLPGLGAALGLRGRLGLAADELALVLAPRLLRIQASARPADATGAERDSGGPALVERGAGERGAPALEKVAVAPLLRHDGRRVEVLRFESEYEPADPGIREAWHSLVGNRSAELRLHRDPGRPRPLLIAVHDLGGGHPALDLHREGLAPLLDALDLDLALMVLPLHGERAEGVRPGEGWFDGSPAWCASALGQSVHELQRATDWLRRQGAPALGLHGRGLGALVAALAAAPPLGLASLVLREPVVCLTDLWRRLAPAPDPAAEAELRERLVGCDPRSLPPPLAGRSLLVSAARADRLAPALAAQTLALRWGADLHGMPGGHWLPLAGRGLQERIADHLRGSLLAPPPDAAAVLTRFRRAAPPGGSAGLALPAPPSPPAGPPAA